MGLFKYSFRKHLSKGQGKVRKKIKEGLMQKVKVKWDSSQQTAGKEVIQINSYPLTT